MCEWNAEKPISELPRLVQLEFREMAKELLNQLDEEYQDIDYIPAPRPQFSNHKVREESNSVPRWYSEIYEVSKRPTKKRLIKSLTNIMNGKDKALVRWGLKEQRYSTGKKHNPKIVTKKVECNWYMYDVRFRDLIYEILTEGYKFTQGTKPSNPLVRTYFGKFTKKEANELMSILESTLIPVQNLKEIDYDGSILEFDDIDYAFNQKDYKKYARGIHIDEAPLSAYNSIPESCLERELNNLSEDSQVIQAAQETYETMQELSLK